MSVMMNTGWKHFRRIAPPLYRTLPCYPLLLSPALKDLTISAIPPKFWPFRYKVAKRGGELPIVTDINHDHPRNPALDPQFVLLLRLNGQVEAKHVSRMSAPHTW